MLALHWYAFKNLRARASSDEHAPLESIKENLRDLASKTTVIGNESALNPESVEQLLNLLEVVRSELWKIDSAASLFAANSKSLPERKTYSIKGRNRKKSESAAFTVARRLLARGEDVEQVAKKTLLPIESVRLLSESKDLPAARAQASINIERERTLL